jgi:hypothetical protein
MTTLGTRFPYQNHNGACFNVYIFYRNNWETCVGSNIFAQFFNEDASDKELKTKASKVKEFYFGEKELNLYDDTFNNLTNLFTDPGFMYGSDLMAR